MLKKFFLVFALFIIVKQGVAQWSVLEGDTTKDDVPFYLVQKKNGTIAILHLKKIWRGSMKHDMECSSISDCRHMSERN